MAAPISSGSLPVIVPMARIVPVMHFAIIPSFRWPMTWCKSGSRCVWKRSGIFRKARFDRRLSLPHLQRKEVPVNDPVRLLELGAISWLRTQAVYHALAELMTEETPDTLILARTEEPYVCVGYHQSLNAVLDEAACRFAGLPIVRRRVGGGTTYLDKNQPFYQCIFHHKHLPYRVDAV